VNNVRREKREKSKNKRGDGARGQKYGGRYRNFKKEKSWDINGSEDRPAKRERRKRRLLFLFLPVTVPTRTREVGLSHLE